METTRGPDSYTESTFIMSKLNDFVPANHLLRPFRQWLNETLVRMDSVFAGMYACDAKGGRREPQRNWSSVVDSCVTLLRLGPRQFSLGIARGRAAYRHRHVASYNMLFRWFVGLAMDAAAWASRL
jgi:hypothetical protein